MTPELALRAIIRPACHDLLALHSPASAALLLAVAMQESGDFAHRRQVPVAHAMGFWQFERGGGVLGVMRHAASAIIAREVCQRLVVTFDAGAIHGALEQNDLLACSFARLLLRTDPKPLPSPEAQSEGAAWDLYIRCWRPGKPHRQHWGSRWRRACQVVELG